MRKLFAFAFFALALPGGIVVAALAHSTPARAQMNCVTMTDNSHLNNGCEREVMVRWSDQGECENGNCETEIEGESSTAITPVEGSACWVVRWYPTNPPRPRC
jgi:hypothetical protein